MSLYELPGHYGHSLEVDVCLECNAIWFGQWDSSQLSPDGVVALFKLIHERGGAASSAGPKLSAGLRCVICGDGMQLVNDRVKNTRFVYQSCRQGHGRFTTFYNFLSEKQFVRELTRAERNKLCATVRQVQCSGCGAPVDLTTHDACAYCRAPISVFDRDAAKKAIDHYLQRRQLQLPAQRPSIDYGHAPNHRGDWDTWDKLYAADLAADLLFALGQAATRGFARPGPAAAGATGTDTAAPSPTDLPGELPDSLLQGMPDGAMADPAGSSSLATATDVLFGGTNEATSASGGSGTFGEMAGEAGNLASGAVGNALEGAGTSLPSATDALFGSTAATDLFSPDPGGAGEVVATAAEILTQGTGEVASGLGDSLGEIVSAAGDPVVDLVSDGIGSLITSILD